MNTKLRLVLAALSLVPLGAFAQDAVRCPTLPADAGLRWELLEGPDFRFCRALRQGDGSELFTVTISGDNPFEPRRGDRAEPAVIDGHEGHWYRSQVAGNPDLIVRETLLELDSGQVAHISLRVADEAQKQEAMRLAGGMRFASDQRLSSN